MTKNELQHHRALLRRALREIEVLVRMDCSKTEIINEIRKTMRETKLPERLH